MDAQAFKDNEREAWDLCARDYDTCLTGPFGPFVEKLLSLACLTRGQKVLDVATGSGLAAFLAAGLVGPQGDVLGVDLSGRMIELATKRAQRDQIHNIGFLRMDAEHLELAASSFDVVLCSLGLMLFPQPDLALSEMYRVIRPGGRAALSVFGPGSKVALRSLIEPFVPHMPPGDQRGPSIFAFGRGDTLHEALARAGFGHIRIEEVDHVLTLQRPEGAWAMMLSLGRLAQMHSRLAEDGQAQLRQQVLKIAQENYQTPQGVMQLPFQITYAVAER